MLTSTLFLFILLLTSKFMISSAAPQNSVSSLQRDQRSLLCRVLSIANLCPKPVLLAFGVQTSIGVASGVSVHPRVTRYAVRYGTANRWKPSSAATTWQLPNNSINVTALPLACPQPNMDPSQYSEDCLSMLLYVPNSLSLLDQIPTLVWIHGGSFIRGSATGPGLDGAKLADATNSIVAVIQHRLGALGFMAPDGTTNLAVKDVVTALNFLRKVLPSIGGSQDKITIAGQSSGANMVRALLAVPSASSLFKSAILQSDPMDFGFLAPSAQQQFQAYFNNLLNCDSSNSNCQSSLSVESILSAQTTLFNTACTINPSATQAEPIRPVRDGTFITTSLTSSTPFPAQSKAVLVSTVMNEAGNVFYGGPAISSYSYPFVVNGALGNQRGKVVLDSPYYQLSASDGGDARPVLEKLGTDYNWRCASWTFARSWAQSGGTVYVGLYTVGATYPDNAAVPFCTQPGSVCHEDDILILFGNTENPTSAQSALTAEIQSRYKQFLWFSNPNTRELPNWSPSTSTDVRAQLLGSSGQAEAGACDPAFWGQAVQYDYQLYSI